MRISDWSSDVCSSYLEEVLARGMRLAAVMVEEHAGAAVHLRDDDALGAVDHEGAVTGHERHVAHVDVLLLDVADRARAGVLVDVPHHQAQRHLERRGEGHAALLALLDVVLRLFQLIAHELQLRPLREVADREDGGENLLQARRSEEHTSELQSLMRTPYAVSCSHKKQNTKT